MPHSQGTPQERMPTSIEEVGSLLIETARNGAQKILQQALEVEIEAHVEANREKLDEDGHRRVVRNGHAPKRTKLTGVGPLEVSRPRVEGQRNCVFVVVGAPFNGEKEVPAITNGERESEAGWKELLLDLKKRGMSKDPNLAIVDGALGVWKALPQVFPSTRMQRFCGSYRRKYPKAVACLERDREVMLTFYSFPGAHWTHIRSTNVIESVFATVRLRTYKTKGMGTSTTTLAMAFKLIKEAEKGRRRITRRQQLELVREGRVFKVGEPVTKESAA